eukprot:4931283-Prymnesium_polylepis.1
MAKVRLKSVSSRADFWASQDVERISSQVCKKPYSCSGRVSRTWSSITDRGVLLNNGNLHDLMGALNNLNVDRMDFHYVTPVCCVMHAA